MPETNGYLLLTAFATAGVHSLIPDHWLPIVLVGRAENWALAKTLRVTALSGVFHILLSFLLGLAVYFAGETAAHAFGSQMEMASLVLLITFGAGYVVYDLMWGHGHQAIEKPGHSESLHLPHLNGGGKGEGKKSSMPWILAAVVGLNPCVLVVPLLVAALARGGQSLLWLTLGVFSLTTVAALLVSTAVGHRGAERFHSRWLERYGGALSGGMVAILGLIFLLKH